MHSLCPSPRVGDIREDACAGPDNPERTVPYAHGKFKMRAAGLLRRSRRVRRPSADDRDRIDCDERRGLGKNRGFSAVRRGVEATGGFEPPNRGFADLRLRPLGYVALSIHTSGRTPRSASTKRSDTVALGCRTTVPGLPAPDALARGPPIGMCPRPTSGNVCHFVPFRVIRIWGMTHLARKMAHRVSRSPYPNWNSTRRKERPVFRRI